MQIMEHALVFALAGGLALFSVAATANVAPVAILKQPADVHLSNGGPYVAQFDASASYDPDDPGPFYNPDTKAFEPRALLFVWEFGDGSKDSGTNLSQTAHTYATTGLYKVSVWVHDGIDLSPESSKWIRVDTTSSSLAPSDPLKFQPFTVTFPYLGEPNENLAFSATGAFDLFSSPTVIYGWRFGDGCAFNLGWFYVGKVAAGTSPVSLLTPIIFDGDGVALQTQKLDGSSVIYAVAITPGKTCRSAGASTTHAYTSAGNYSATLIAYEVNGTQLISHSAAHSVVINRRPVAVASVSRQLGRLTVAFSSAGSADPDGQAIIYYWDFGDGSKSTEPNPMHVYSKRGTYNVTLIVNDAYHPSTPAVTSVRVGDDGWLVPVINLLLQ